jgi:hypothetical protein
MHVFQGDFFSPVTDGEVDFTKTTSTQATLDRVTIKWSIAAGVGEFHGFNPAIGVRIAGG